MAAEIGVRTFLIADVRGYTSFTLARGDEAAARLAGRFAEIARETVDAHGGRVVELRGDEALAVFSSARGALRAAAAMQERYAAATDADPETPLRVGIGVDAGEAVPVDGGFRGAALNLAARLCSLAGPGEVLTTEAVTHLARRVEGLAYVNRGASQLKGFADPVPIFRLETEVRAQSPMDMAAGADAEAVRQALPIGGFLGSLPPGLLVARDDEFGRAVEALRAVEAGEGRFVLLVGEPGAGKTRIAQEITLAARNSGFLIAAGRCYEAEASTPYFPFVDALSAAVEAAPPDVRQTIAGAWPYLGAVLPDLVPVPEGVDSPDAPQRVSRAVAGLLQTLAEWQPVALLLDDLHWADSASLKMLQYLARHTRTHRVLMLGTYRDVEVERQHPLEAALREMAREGLTERIVVRRLDRAGTGRLMAAAMGEEDISDEFAALVHDRTEGNPFFVQQVMRDMVERGDVYRESGRWERKEIDAIQVPESVRSVIGQRLSRLADDHQTVLREASILGQTFSFDDLVEIGGHGEDEVDGALDAASRIGLVREMESGRYAFDHALTQSTLHAELTLRRRRRLHLQAAEAMAALPEVKRRRRVAEIAWHFLQGDDDRALEYCILAGDDAEAVFAHAEAEMHYRTALDLLSDLPNAATEIAVLTALGTVLQRAVRYDEALEVFERVAELHRAAGDRAGEARTIAALTGVHAARGTVLQMLPRLEVMAEEAAVDSDPAVGAPIWVALSRVLFVSGRYEEAVQASQRGATLARSAGDEALFVEAEIRRGSSLGQFGRSDEYVEVLENILPLARRVVAPERLVTVLNNVGFAHLRRGETTRSLPYRQEAYEIACKLADPSWIMFTAAMMTQELFSCGEWDEARRFADEAVQNARSVSGSGTIPYAIGWQAWLQTWQGEWDEARILADEALALSRAAGDRQGAIMSAVVVARLALFEGRAGDAVSVLSEEVGDSTAGHSWYMPTQAWAYLEAGDLDAALRTAEQAVTACRSEIELWVLAEALWVYGKVLGTLKRTADAASAFSESIERCRTMRYPFVEALSLLAWAELDVEEGNVDAARDRLEAALTIFRRLGAVPLLRRAEAALEGL